MNPLIQSSTTKLPFSDFIERLKRNGFMIGVDHYVRLQMVIKEFGPSTPPARLKYMLCPVFAVNRKQQELFYRLFDQYFDLYTAADGGPVVAPSDRREEGESAAEPKEPFTSRRLLWVSFGAIMSIVVAGLLWYFLPTIKIEPVKLPVANEQDVPFRGKPSPQRQPNIKVTIPLKMGDPPRLRFYERYQRHIKITGMILPLLLFLLNELYHRNRRRLVLQRDRSRRKKKPPYLWQMKADPPPPGYFKTGLFFTAANNLRQRLLSDTYCLDVEGSVNETISRSGFPVLRYKALTRPPEYLFLIDLSQNRSHFANYL